MRSPSEMRFASKFSESAPILYLPILAPFPHAYNKSHPKPIDAFASPVYHVALGSGDDPHGPARSENLNNSTEAIGWNCRSAAVHGKRCL
jgi:hypothetical protein